MVDSRKTCRSDVDYLSPTPPPFTPSTKTMITKSSLTIKHVEDWTRQVPFKNFSMISRFMKSRKRSPGGHLQCKQLRVSSVKMR